MKPQTIPTDIWSTEAVNTQFKWKDNNGTSQEKRFKDKAE